MVGSLEPRNRGDGRCLSELGDNWSRGGEGGSCMSFGLSCGEGSSDEMMGDSMENGGNSGTKFLGAMMSIL